MQKFITDLGTSHIVRHADGTEFCRLGRYAVWSDEGRRKPEVIVQSDDLEELQREHGPLEVFDIRPK